MNFTFHVLFPEKYILRLKFCKHKKLQDRLQTSKQYRQETERVAWSTDLKDAS